MLQGEEFFTSLQVLRLEGIWLTRGACSLWPWHPPGVGFRRRHAQAAPLGSFWNPFRRQSAPGTGQCTSRPADLLVQHRGQGAHELSDVHHNALGQRAPAAAARAPRQRVGCRPKQQHVLLVGGRQAAGGVDLRQKQKW